MSQNRQQLQNLWKLREYISETASHWTPYKDDILVTVSRVPASLKDIDAIVEANCPDSEVVWSGYIGDGSLHLNTFKSENLGKDESFARCATVNKWMFETVGEYNGSISAEHGVGMTRRDYSTYTRPETEIVYMKTLKAVFDPNGIMSPGKIFVEQQVLQRRGPTIRPLSSAMDATDVSPPVQESVNGLPASIHRWRLNPLPLGQVGLRRV